MLLKLGVSIEKLGRNIRRALPHLEDAFERLTHEEPVITSTFEGNHSAGSLHYANNAIDVRLPRIRAGEIVDSLKNSLGGNFDVILEGDHIHVEFDPK